MTRSFPAPNAEGGPWYYNGAVATPIGSQESARFIQERTEQAGWQPAANPLTSSL